MSEIPVQVRGVDVFKLPLSTTEGFVLSRVDGASSVDDIAMMCGLDGLQVMSILQRLVQLGAVSWAGAKIARAPSGPAVARERITISPPAAPVVEHNAARRSVPPPRMEAPTRGEPPPRVQRAAREITPVVPAERATRPPTPAERATRPASQPDPVAGVADRAQRVQSDPQWSPASDAGGSAGDIDSQRPTMMPAAGEPGASYDEAELLEDVEIEMERRKRILEVFHGPSEQTHYERLGLQQDADKASVKRAYYALSKEFHPDSLFGRRLGTYKQKMEAVFRLLTEAHDVLAKPKRRKEYDEYLAATAQTRRAKDILDRGDREAAVIEKAVRASLQGIPRADAVTPMPASEPPSAAGRGNQPSPPPGRRTPQPPPASLRPPRLPTSAGSSDEQLRMAQQALRRRLQAATGRPASTPPARGSIPPSGPPPAESTDAARGDALRGLASSLRAAHAVTGADRVNANVKRAQQAEAANDLVGASNFYRLALAAAPGRADLQRDFDRVSAALAAQLADSYEKQAHYEERAGRWKEAAAAWVKVCDGRPNDAHASRATAHALLRANGDLHTALKYAKHHVELAGENGANLTLLARVYLAAGLKLNARRELEKAAKLDPSDDMIKNLLKEAR